MGERLLSFSVNGDAGATFPPGTVYTQVCTARPGDIVISHMNPPGGGTFPGFARAIPALKAKGLTFRTLSQVAAAAPTPPSSWVTIALGSRGAEVVVVQRVLHVSADGIFGPVTQAAVVGYQRAHNLVPDGIVGPLTARSMGLA